MVSATWTLLASKLNCLGITKSHKAVRARASAVLSITGESTGTSHLCTANKLRLRYDMDFGGSLYASSAFVRTMAMSANQPSI